MSFRQPVDLTEEPGTVRRSEGGFTQPLPAPRAQDGDMSIPELNHQDPRFEAPKHRTGVLEEEPA